MLHVPTLGAALLFAFLFGCSRTGPDIAASYPLSRISERVYVIHGPNDLPNANNQGFINNPGFVLTKRGVVVIDPGSSLQVGAMVLRAVATVTREPVVAVFNTHIHGDHWLGNDAIRRIYPQAVIYAHPNMIRAAATDGVAWLARLSTATDKAVRGTQLVVPSLGVENDEVVGLGGMHFRAYHNGAAHTDGDLMVEVVEEKVLFTGDNIVAQRAGRFDEANIKGMIAACDIALQSPALHIVPGHGPSGGREVIAQHRAWLSKLHGVVQRLQGEGVSDMDMKARALAELKEYRHWKNFDQEIGKIISLVALQIEKESF